jgi:dihydroorotate dehydrogenase subfamily 1
VDVNGGAARLREMITSRANARATVTTGPPRERTHTPIATVSGVASTTTDMIDWFRRETPVTMITTKSVQLHPNPGNREPIITEAEPGSFGNAVGLKNSGVDVAVAELRDLRRRWSQGDRIQPLLAISLSAVTPEEFVALARATRDVADLLELNYSCPHAASGYGADIGRDEAAIAAITAAVVAAVPETPILVKLTPNVPDIARMATVAVAAGAAGITAINTVGPAVYRHGETGAPILSNPPDGRGGQSGEWVRPAALDAVAATRREVGPEPVIVGMGGVATAADAAAMRQAGADIVGVGSALARVHQRDWPEYLAALAGSVAPDDRVSPDRAVSALLRDSAGMDLLSWTVTARRELGDGLFELDIRAPGVSIAARDRETPQDAAGRKYAPGKSVFLWVPGVGEKPFAPAVVRSEAAGEAAAGEAVAGNAAHAPRSTAELTFLIRRRGPVTDALGAVQPGSLVYLRGPYGDGHTPAPVMTLLVGAGSGAAVLPGLAAAICAGGGSVTTLIGTRQALRPGTTTAALQLYGPVRVVPDEGVQARVLGEIPGVFGSAPVRRAYVCGPEPFMSRATAVLSAAGLSGAEIFLSLERSMRCGVGMCGECHNRGRLTCQYGTIVPMTEFDR